MRNAMRILALTLALLMTGGILAACAREEGDTSSAFCVVVNGVNIELGKPAQPVLDALGMADQTDEVNDCGAGNSRMRYRYDSVVIYAMKSDGKAVIDQIELLDDLAETSRGICLGDDEAAVREAYGTPTQDADGILGYGKDGRQIQFNVEEGKVVAIGLLRKTQ